MRLAKGLALISLLPSHPREFADRVRTIIEVRLDGLSQRPVHYEALPLKETLDQMDQTLGLRMDAFLEEKSALGIEEHVRQSALAVALDAPFAATHNADFALARICYALCRAMQPKCVLETGVAYGVTTAFILQALAVNNTGILHSVDLPPLARTADRFVGYFVPEELRSRWVLHRGSARRVLPNLLPELGSLNMFVHDSLHTARHMRWEFETVTPFIASPGILVADDVGGNSAFSGWVDQAKPRFSAVVHEPDKGGLFGVAVI